MLLKKHIKNIIHFGDAREIYQNHNYTIYVIQDLRYNILNKLVNYSFINYVKYLYILKKKNKCRHNDSQKPNGALRQVEKSGTQTNIRGM